MRGFLSGPSPSPTLSPIYDGLDVSATSTITSFHSNHDMVSCRIYTDYSSTESSPQHSPVNSQHHNSKIKTTTRSYHTSFGATATNDRSTALEVQNTQWGEAIWRWRCPPLLRVSWTGGSRELGASYRRKDTARCALRPILPRRGSAYHINRTSCDILYSLVCS